MEPTLPDWTLEPLARYLELLDRWSLTHALTALGKADRFEELILDSAALLPFLQVLPPHSRVVDFGTGMGIPALPIALARPCLPAAGPVHREADDPPLGQTVRDDQSDLR